MKIAIWTGFALLALSWTGLVWVAAELTRWVGDLVASGAAVDWASAAGTIRFPGWLTWWVDPALIESIIDTVVWTLEAANAAMPWFDSVSGWLVALLWVGWVTGTLLLLLLAAGLHLVVSRKA